MLVHLDKRLVFFTIAYQKPQDFWLAIDLEHEAAIPTRERHWHQRQVGPDGNALVDLDGAVVEEADAFPVEIVLIFVDHINV